LAATVMAPGLNTIMLREDV